MHKKVEWQTFQAGCKGFIEVASVYCLKLISDKFNKHASEIIENLFLRGVTCLNAQCEMFDLMRCQDIREIKVSGN